jgi:outer membrane protein TolC
MQLTRFLLALLSVAATTLGAETASSSKRIVSLEDCIQMALQHNLDLQIERYNPQISLHNLSVAYAGYDPNFTISGEHDFSLAGGGIDPTTKLALPASTSDANSFRSGLTGLLPYGLNYNFFGNISESYGTISTNTFDNTRGTVGVSLTQPLLKNFWIDGTRLNIRVFKNRLKFSEAGLRLRVMLIANDTEQAYYDLIAALENVKVQEKALELAERLLAENKKRVEVGALAPLDEKQAESQVAARRSDLLAAQQVLAFQQNVLKKLLSDNYTSVHDVDFEPSENLSAPVQVFNLQDSWSKGLSQRPDLAQSKLDLEQQGIQLRYNRNQLFPQLDLIGSYGHAAGGAGVVEFSDGLNSFREGDRPFYSYGAQLSIPLGNRAARNRYKNSKVAVEQALLVLKRLERDVMVQIDDAIKVARTQFQRVESTHQARLYSEAALDAAQKKLENGKSTSFEVLQLQRDLTAARSLEIQALADYNKALSQLSFNEGATLERNRIDLNVK